jgi:putative FmdB family regulatory protein
MPTYDYRCDACGHTFDKFQSMSADVLTTCPACEKDSLRRLIGTGAGIIFKGGGFYETDYRNDAYAKDAKKDSGESSDGKKKDDDKGSETKTESKPETTAKSESASKPADSSPSVSKPNSSAEKSTT